VAVASTGPYANHLHLAADRQSHQYPTTQFLQARCPSCHPTNIVKALKDELIQLRLVISYMLTVLQLCAEVTMKVVFIFVHCLVHCVSEVSHCVVFLSEHIGTLACNAV